MSQGNKDILRLFERPKEPTFFVKGNQNAVFNVPTNFIESRFRPIGVQLTNRFGEKATEQIAVKNIPPPNLGLATSVTRYENFSLFFPKHRKAAGALIQIFMAAPSGEDLKATAVYARDRVNPYLFNYALSVAIMHRPDTKNLDVPSFISTFPDKFMDGTILQKAREEASIVPDGSRIPIVIPRDYTASDLEEEHRIAYWREDLGINLHHWHWHLVYPFSGPDAVVRKDRRGELFYFMHQQIQSRYNFERLSNKLARVERLLDWRAPIKEAYFPKLNTLVASRAYPARVANSSIQDVNRQVDQVKVDIQDAERWRDRMFAAIHAGAIQMPDGSTQPLGINGVDILGNILEASTITPNRNFYGDLHNMLHVMLGTTHDPDGRFLESFGAVADPSTAMRDPAFYRLHEFVDDVFQEFKQTLPPYTAPELNYQNIAITALEVDVEGSQKNVFQTFWQQSDVEISRGLDFTPRGPVFVRFTHLQHAPFTWKVTVNNTSNQQRMGTCRIFISPKFDEKGTTWLLRDQRLMFIEMDRFTVTLKQGQNVIQRRSVDSALTIPYERTFRDVDTNRPAAGTPEELEFNFCGCGWPQHVLVPKGDASGFKCDLFVMISNYDDDKIEQPPPTGRCSDAFTYCGLKDRLYPDKRPMGYPFDRLPAVGVDTIQQFLFPNMRLQDVDIKFTEKTVVGNQPVRP